MSKGTCQTRNSSQVVGLPVWAASFNGPHESQTHPIQEATKGLSISSKPSVVGLRETEVFVHELIPIRMCPDAQIFDLSLVAKRPPTGTQLPAGRRAVLALLQISANLF